MNVQAVDLSGGFVIALVIVGAIQLTLDVVALVDLVRRPTDRVTLGNKWVWVAIILLVNLLGAILYLAVGRKPAPAPEVLPPQRTGTRSGDVADTLYGRREPEQRDEPDAGPR